jgi:excisionase family DNA binding protein
MMTVSEVARLVHVHPNTLRRWSDQGVIRTFRISSRGDRRYRKLDVHYFLSELRAHHGNHKEVKVSWS